MLFKVCNRVASPDAFRRAFSSNFTEARGFCRCIRAIARTLYAAANLAVDPINCVMSRWPTRRPYCCSPMLTSLDCGPNRSLRRSLARSRSGIALWTRPYIPRVSQLCTINRAPLCLRHQIRTHPVQLEDGVISVRERIDLRHCRPAIY